MRCPKCGSTVEKGNEFCENCGTKLEGDPITTPSAEEPEASYLLHGFFSEQKDRPAPASLYPVQPHHILLRSSSPKPPARQNRNPHCNTLPEVSFSTSGSDFFRLPQ